MVYALSLSISGLTEAQASAAVTAIKTRLDAKPRWDVSAAGYGRPHDTLVLYALARYNTRIDLDSVVSTARSYLNKNLPSGAHGTLEIHDCTHDGSGPCLAPTVVWSA